MSDGRLEVQPGGSVRELRVNDLALCLFGVVGGWSLILLGEAPSWLVFGAVPVSLAAPVVVWLVSPKLSHPTTLWLDGGVLGHEHAGDIREVPVSSVLDAVCVWVPYSDPDAVFHFPDGLQIKCQISEDTKPFLFEVLTVMRNLGRTDSISNKLATKVGSH